MHPVAHRTCSQSRPHNLSTSRHSRTSSRRSTLRPHASSSAPLASSLALEPGPENVWYMAFGSNMNPQVLTDRRGVVPLMSAPCTVPGYTMGFHSQGYSTLEPYARPVPLQEEDLPPSERAPINRLQLIKSRSRAYQARWVYGHTAHGVVHLIKKDDWARVQLTEGVLPPFTTMLQVGYQVIGVRCELYDGEWVSAETLSAGPSFRGDPWTSKPTLRYQKLLIEGARHHGVSNAYVELLGRQPISQTEVSLEIGDPLRTFIF